MRPTTGAVLFALLVVAGCTDRAEKPEVPEPGPLRLAAHDKPCAPGEDGSVEWSAVWVENTGEVPLTIDAITLTQPRNLLLTEVLLDGATPAVDATLDAGGEAGARMKLTLQLRPGPDDGVSRFDGLTIDYHNVDGDFRAVSSHGLEFNRSCPSAP